jgi:Ca2+-binding RTX toxin-like protein
MSATRLFSIALALVLAAAVSATAATAMVAAGGATTADITGTSNADTLVGTSGNDVMRGWKGDDRISGMDGDDVIYGGRGADALDGGSGNDTIESRDEDSAADVVTCGPGTDRVVANASDRVSSDCEQVSGASTSGTTTTPAAPTTPTAPTAAAAPSGRSVVLVDQAWTCRTAVDLDLVKVTMRSAGSDAIYLRQGCSGRIGRIEVDTWTADGLKVNAGTPGPQNLTIGGGYIRCYAQTQGHQDGIQAMGGRNVTFNGLQIKCGSNPNAQLFINSVNGGNPTNVVCNGCLLGRGAASTLLIKSSSGSGARNSTICKGRYFDVRIEGAVSPVNTGNTVIPSTDPRCG